MVIIMGDSSNDDLNIFFVIKILAVVSLAFLSCVCAHISVHNSHFMNDTDIDWVIQENV